MKKTTCRGAIPQVERQESEEDAQELPLLPEGDADRRAKHWRSRGAVLAIMREKYTKEFKAQAGGGGASQDHERMGKTKQRAVARRQFPGLTVQAKLNILRSCLAHDLIPTDLMESANAMVLYLGGDPEETTPTQPQEERIFKYRGSGTLLTFHGDWSRINDPGCEEELRKWQAEESQGRSPQRVLESVAKRLRSNPQILHLWGAFEKYTQQFRQGRAIRRMTWALELHNEKSLSTGEVWVHTHLMFDCLGTTVSLSRNSGLTFMNTYPHTSVDCVKARGRAVKKAFDQGHYYLSVAKLGGILSGGNVTPNQSYPVNPEWVTQWWQQNKITSETAASEYVQCKRHVQKYLENLEYQEKAERHGKLAALKRKADEDTKFLMKKTRRLATVDEEFLPQFSRAMLRRKFLVLDGPSRLGKTLFTYSLCEDVSQTLEVNCSRCMEPNLKGFDPTTHRCILFDEAKAAMVVEHKGLFQGRNTWVDMATSGTNCYSYKVWTYGTMLVVTSNKWQTELEALPKADADWLEQNCVYVHVDTPLYEE